VITPSLTESVVDLSDRTTLHDYDAIARSSGLRTIMTASEELPRAQADDIRRAAAVAVIHNPWIGTGTDEDLAPATRRIAPLLAKLLTDRLRAALGGAPAIQAFGKAAFVGSAGELEHAAAFIHTPYFGNLMREALEGSSILCFVDGHASPGDVVRIPLWHKTAAATRDYYQTITVDLPDAPHPDEIVVIAAASTGPRPHARIGDRTTDAPVTSDILKEITL